MTVTKATIGGTVNDPSFRANRNDKVTIWLETGGAGHGYTADGALVGPVVGLVQEDGSILARDGSPIQVPTNDTITNVANSYYSAIAGRMTKPWNFQLTSAQAGLTIPFGASKDSNGVTIIVSTPANPIATGPQGPLGPTGGVGPQGPSGPTGTTGPLGPSGPTGTFAAAADQTIIGNNSGGTAIPQALTPSTARTVLGAAADSTVVHKANADTVTAPAASGNVLVADALVKLPMVNEYEPIQRNGPLLTRFWHRLGSSKVVPVKIVALGASGVEGTGALGRDTKWTSLVRDVLRQHYGKNASYPVSGFYPFYCGATGAETVGGSYNGSADLNTWPAFHTKVGVTRETTYGLGLQNAKWANNTDSITFTFTGDRFQIHASKTSDGNVLSYTVDGGAAANNDLYAAAYSETIIDSGALTWGAHTIVITTKNTGGANPSPSYVAHAHGVTINTGDYAAGMQMFNGGHGGIGIDTLATGITNVTAAVKAIDPDLIIIGADTVINSINGGRTVNQCQTDMQTVITSLLTAHGGSNISASLAMFMPWPNSLASSGTLQPYWTMLEGLCATNGIAVIRWGQVTSSLASPDTNGVAIYDYTHPSQRGQEAIAQSTLAAILPGALPTPGNVAALFAEKQPAPGDVVGANALLTYNTTTGAVSTITAAAAGTFLELSTLGILGYTSAGNRRLTFACAGSTALSPAAAPPSGLTEIDFGLGAGKYRRVADLSYGTQMRLSAMINQAGASGSILKVQYATNFTSPSWNDLGLSISLTSTGLIVNSAWTTPSGAGVLGGVGDVILRLCTLSGNGSTNPSFGYVDLEFR